MVNANHQDHRVSLQPAFILHGREYGDTSRLLDVFTRDYGRITLVAKGARSPRSKLQGILQVFTPLIISWSGKGEVQTLTGAESVKSSINLTGKNIISGYYINELLQRLMTHHDPHPDLYTIYQKSLQSFTVEENELILRRFEKNLLAEIGYGLSLEYETENGNAIDKDEIYYYDIEKGPVNIRAGEHSDALSVSGQTLIDLDKEIFSSAQSQKEAKQLMRVVLSHHLGGKPLKTRNLHWYKPL
jgi:DNA repair protein RecO (recombination protein O)